MIFKNCTFFNEMFEKEVGDIKVENGKIAELGRSRYERLPCFARICRYSYTRR